MRLKNYLSFMYGHREKSLDAIIYMLRASFFAPRFRNFWQRWNPLWSYFTLYFVYRPLSKILPRRVAGLLTFVVSGFLHDCVAMALTAEVSVVMTVMFSIWGVIVWAEDIFVSQKPLRPVYLRPIYHLACLLAGAVTSLCLFW